jgi:hypothetical protein
MATRRRSYKDGGVVVPRDGGDGEAMRPQANVAPPPVAAQDAPAAASYDDVDPVKRGLAEIQRAEQMHRQQAPEPPQLSRWKQDFLAAYPELIRDEEATSLTRYHYLSALRRGIRDDSPEMNEAILSGWKRMSGAHLPAPDAHRQARSDAIEREADQMDAVAPTSASKKAPQFVTAPVSRAMPSMTSGAMPTRITLSPEQVMVARNSWTDSSMTNEQKEKMYAMNLARMMDMRRRGTLNE